PEQVGSHVLAPQVVDYWVNRWGTSASPLLWSHAMYLLLTSMLRG
ncbi:MAG: glycoside hydrolase family 15, partial [Anaerolineae bacterium]|nr:glycoside hydrolase family 15 [Anaerolineae bacterium]